MSNFVHSFGYQTFLHFYSIQFNIILYLPEAIQRFQSYVVSAFDGTNGNVYCHTDFLYNSNVDLPFKNNEFIYQFNLDIYQGIKIVHK